MKKWMYFAALFAAAFLLSRLPHPAKDISLLEPVQIVYLYKEGDMLCLETDTGARGRGRSLTEAAEAMRARADGEIFLETAEFLLLDPDVKPSEDFFRLLRPDCGVFYTERRPDLSASARYLSMHQPETKLRDLRRIAALREGGVS